MPRLRPTVLTFVAWMLFHSAAIAQYVGTGQPWPPTSTATKPYVQIVGRPPIATTPIANHSIHSNVPMNLPQARPAAPVAATNPVPFGPPQPATSPQPLTNRTTPQPSFRTASTPIFVPPSVGYDTVDVPTNVPRWSAPPEFVNAVPPLPRGARLGSNDEDRDGDGEYGKFEEDDEGDDESDEQDEQEDEGDEEEDEDTWTLHDFLTPDSSIDYGGWMSMGYHSSNTRLSRAFNDRLAYNDRPDLLNVHQAWLFTEKEADPSCCTCDWGYRFDIFYGIDAQDCQANGNANNVWDVSLDRGAYGWAMPQAYLEFAYGEWNIMVGHFYALMGYESMIAPDNFFYSHSLTMYNSEPFTHTGVLASVGDEDFFTLYTGWTLGWDTGFDQFGSGSSFLGGMSTTVAEDVTLTYVLTAGNFGLRSADLFGYAQSFVLEVVASDSLEYVVQTDYTHTNGFNGDPTTDGVDFGLVNYLYYDLDEIVSLGTRVEWWKSNTVTGENTSFFEVTGGINFQLHPNLVIRPEIRHDWTPSEKAVGKGYNLSVFAVDAVLTF